MISRQSAWVSNLHPGLARRERDRRVASQRKKTAGETDMGSRTCPRPRRQPENTIGSGAGWRRSGQSSVHTGVQSTDIYIFVCTKQNQSHLPPYTFARGRGLPAAGPWGPTGRENRTREPVTAPRVDVRVTIQIILQTNPEKNLFTI